MSLAPPLVLREGDRRRLSDLARLPSVPSGLAKRARIVLLAADGMPNAQIARTVGVSRPTVIGWRERYAAGGIRALLDEPRSGRPAVIDEIDVVVATLANDGRPPERLGIPHWSARFLAAELGISFASVARIWRKWGIQPHRIRAFKFSTDPELDARIRDVVGLYVDPPEGAVVVSIDEKPQIRALDPTAPMPHPRPGLPARRARDGDRDGACALLEALEVAAGRITADARCPKRRHQEFVGFLTQTAAAHPGARLHVVVGNYATRKHPKLRAWLKDNPGITMHVTPAGSSWLNMAEICFGVATRQVIRPGTFTPAKELTAAVARFIDAYHDRCEPFAWTRDPDELLAIANCQKNNATRRREILRKLAGIGALALQPSQTPPIPAA
jgi:transposase